MWYVNEIILIDSLNALNLILVLKTLRVKGTKRNLGKVWQFGKKLKLSKLFTSLTLPLYTLGISDME